MERISNTRKNRNLLRLAAVATVVIIQVMFGGSRLHESADNTRHANAGVSVGQQPVMLQSEVTRTSSAGGQNSQLSLMIFRSN